MQDWFKERFPLFFEKGTFEIQRVWDNELDKQVAITLHIRKKLGISPSFSYFLYFLNLIINF